MVYVTQGEIFDVCVDIRRGSPAFARWTGTTLSADNFRQVILPAGCAHGLVVMSERAEVILMTSAPYSPGGELTIAWNDPLININWPTEAPLLSHRDSAAPPLSDILDLLPTYEEQEVPKSSRGCFLSYSTSNADFVGKLYKDLMRARIPCWWAPESMSPGDQLREAFQSAIQTHHAFLLILSSESLHSDWVKSEVETALEREREQYVNIIRPLTLDADIFKTGVAWAAHLRRTRHIADFSRWREKSWYTAALKKLISMLRETPR
jgi:hypothetical protein